eukprot:CAMPEP_0116835900 /NCGR_PEP_ID=MMETSP0418-20121206/7793_1 /TAXON_ID=1158023 /ORGANISM="Astrosyne radiata, Strain 13vi08-1A" /LENGTH=42 /DNA_ID= /DNA_START= /DNA_END= /DNA_ORIENTATION=
MMLLFGTMFYSFPQFILTLRFQKTTRLGCGNPVGPAQPCAEG